MIACLSRGVDREGSGTPLIGMYKGNVPGFMCAHRLIHLDIFVPTTFFGFQHMDLSGKSLYMRPHVVCR